MSNNIINQICHFLCITDTLGAIPLLRPKKTKEANQELNPFQKKGHLNE
jgi:hypothetical protein